MIKVRATQIGYFDHRRIKVGEIFTIKSMDQFSEKWMSKDLTGRSKAGSSERKQRPLSDGSKAVHEDTVADPKKGAQDQQQQDDQKQENDQKQPDQKQDDKKDGAKTTGDEEMI